LGFLRQDLISNKVIVNAINKGRSF
jgi:hypothetical protein